MNLIAVSGAILITLMPLPRHSDLTPPSRIIWVKPPMIPLVLVFLEPWAWGCHNQQIHSACIHTGLPFPFFSSSSPSPWSELPQHYQCNSWVILFTCMNTLSLSSGAVQVRDTAPAPAPATRCRHNIPFFFSSAVNSSGTNRLSPTSKICGGRRVEPDVMSHL